MTGFFNNKYGAKLVLGLAGTGMMGYAIYNGYSIRHGSTLWSAPSTTQKIEGIKAQSIYIENTGSNVHQEIKHLESQTEVEIFNSQQSIEKQSRGPK